MASEAPEVDVVEFNAAAVRVLIDGKAKPPGAMGLLESWAVRLCEVQRTMAPSVRPGLLVFAADHGAARPHETGGAAVSAFPQTVTPKILEALMIGDAGGAVFASIAGIPPEHRFVVDVGVVWNSPPYEGVYSRRPRDIVAEEAGETSGSHPGDTCNMAVEPAMTLRECEVAMEVGAEILHLACGKGLNTVALGEAGIGNTTASAALLSVFTSESPQVTAGPGSGLDAEGVSRKAAFIESALDRHADVVTRARANPVLEGAHALAAVGGFEIAAMVGAVHAAFEKRVAVMVDGFISSVAALVAVRLRPACAECLFLSTRSPEKGHAICISALEDAIEKVTLKPIAEVPRGPALNMGLRLGEGTAACLAIPLLHAAAKLATDFISLEDALKR